MLKLMILSQETVAESSLLIHHCNLARQGSHIKIQIFLEQKVIVKRFKNQHNQEKTLDKDNQILLLDQMWWELMMQQLKTKMEVFIMQFPQEMKVNGRVVFLLQHNKIQSIESCLVKLTKEEQVYMEIMKVQKLGSQKKA